MVSKSSASNLTSPYVPIQMKGDLVLDCGRDVCPKNSGELWDPPSSLLSIEGKELLSEV
jgi:hypothetical protein